MEQSAILEVTRQFRPVANYRNPPYCSEVMIEQAYFNHWAASTASKRKRVYLPIFWTNVYVHGGYKSDPNLQSFLDNLPRDQQYYTVIQYDDGILENIDGLDIMTFSAGHPQGIPIPLLPSHMPQPQAPQPKIGQIYACFNNTHPIRTAAKEALKGNPNIAWAENRPWQDYLKQIDNYALCLAPRGYGITSFRMYEAIMLGSVPIYLSDIFWMPYMDIIDYTLGGVILRNELDLYGSMIFDAKETMLKDVAQHHLQIIKEMQPFFTMEFAVQYIHNYAKI